jgi:hypothetical protein
MWGASQASPWDTVNETNFIFDAFAAYSIIEDRDLTAPPGSCANGARYLVDTAATGAWSGKDGLMAIAIGPNASNGWYYAVVARQGVRLAVNDEGIDIINDGAAWITAPGGVSFFNDLTDVNAPSPSDGDVPVWDAGDSEWKSQAPAATYTDEQARDAIGTALTEGAGIDITVNDGADTITIASTISQYTDEMARDALGTALVAGTGISITPNDGADTITIAATGGGGSAKPFLEWGPRNNEPPASNYATLDLRNQRPVLDFDTTTQEAAIFSGVLSSAYAGGGITVDIYCMATSATTGTIGWDVAIERIDTSSLDTDSDSFASAQTVTAVTVPGTSGQILKMSVNISNGANMDSLAAGEAFRLRIRRDVANDNAAGDAELLSVTMREQ